MGGRQGRARELVQRDRLKSEGIHPNTSASVEAVRLLFEKAPRRVHGILGEENKIDFNQIEATIQEICAEYWDDWNYFNSPSLHEAKPWADKVLTATRTLIDLIDHGDAFANDAAVALSPSWPATAVQRLDHLEALETACFEIMASKTPKGPKRKLVAVRTVKRLAKLWELLTGRRFSRNFKRLKLSADAKKKTDEFESRSGQFVQLLCNGIDPQLTFSQIQSAMRKALKTDH